MRVEHLRFHLARLQRAGQLEEAVGERRLAVIDVRDHGEIANLLRIQWSIARRLGRSAAGTGDRCNRRADE